MRATVVGLAALPVAAVGLALVAAVMGPDDEQPPAPQPERTATASTEATSGPSEDTRAATPTSAGTPIEGIRPYLTVIDGLSTLPVPAPIPAVLSALPVPQVELAPLPPRTGETAALPGAATASRSEARAGDDDRGTIRDLLDEERPLGSTASEDDAGRATDADPRDAAPDREPPADPPPVVDPPGMEQPGGGEVVDEPLKGGPAPGGGGRPPLTGTPPLTGPPPAPHGPPVGGPPTDPVDPVRPTHPIGGDGPQAGPPVAMPVPDAPPVDDTVPGDLGVDGDDDLPAR